MAVWGLRSSPLGWFPDHPRGVVKTVLKISVLYTPVETEEERANENEWSLGIAGVAF
jgi:hypothetical protein